MKSLALASLPVLLVATLFSLPWERDLIYGFVPGAMPPPEVNPVVAGAYTRSTVHFTSQGTKCEAWLYLPEPQLQKPPVVILGHGLGGQKDMALHRYAERFAAAGMAALLFDYRTFGGSDGHPRHWVSPKRHLQDWEAAYHYVKNTAVEGQVDASRVALWGTSFAGGHVLVTASKPGVNVSAVVSQVPHLSGRDASRSAIKNKGILSGLRLLSVALHDALRHLFGLDGAYIQLVGTHSDLALMQMGEEQLRVYFSKHPPVRQVSSSVTPSQHRNLVGGWKNQVLARVILEMGTYNPITSLPGIRAPVLLIAAEKDQLCPGALVRAAAEQLPGKGQIVSRDCNHFDIYRGDNFEVVVTEMTEFLRARLLVSTETY